VTRLGKIDKDVAVGELSNFSTS